MKTKKIIAALLATLALGATGTFGVIGGTTDPTGGSTTTSTTT